MKKTDTLKLFLKENKLKRDNVFYKATESLKDENGETLSWEIRHITTDEDERIRNECLKEAEGRGIKLDVSRYLKKMAAASVVFPPLANAALQDSYGAMTPEELLSKMIDDPGEYQRFIRFVQKTQGFDVGLREKAEEAKNL